MRTSFPKKAAIERKWYLIDASGLVLGRLAAKVASILRGKHRPIFTPHVDTGDFVVVINADKIRFTGKKLDNKVYQHHSGYPGGLKTEKAGDLLKSNPERLITMAVWGMLPKNSLGRDLIKKLKVYKGQEHPHTAQKPEALS